jgi:predicted CoA-binding protein
MIPVAIIGASTDRTKFGNKAVRAFLRQGYMVYPVNPREPLIEGLRAFATIADVPVRPSLVSVYVRPAVLMGMLEDIAAKGCDELWLNPGTESADVLARAWQLKLNVVQGCSVLAIGVSPADFQ